VESSPFDLNTVRSCLISTKAGQAKAAHVGGKASNNRGLFVLPLDKQVDGDDNYFVISLNNKF
jgi:hypothetical protein